jgi:hypothetical protein
MARQIDVLVPLQIAETREWGRQHVVVTWGRTGKRCLDGVCTSFQRRRLATSALQTKVLTYQDCLEVAVDPAMGAAVDGTLAAVVQSLLVHAQATEGVEQIPMLWTARESEQ